MLELRRGHAHALYTAAKLTIMAGLFCTIALSPRVLAAQRPAPHITDAGNPATGVITKGALVAWDYWGIQTEDCHADAAGTACTLSIGNGNAEAHTLCIGAASFTPDSLHASVGSPKGVISFQGPDNSQCVKLTGHQKVQFSLRAKTRGAAPRSILIALLERTSELSSATIMRATANVPTNFGSP